MCSPKTVFIERSSELFSNTLKGINILGSTATSISDFKANKDNYAYRTQIALNNAKIAQNEALRQKQLGIEESRLEKISGLQELSKIQAKNSASNLDMMSQTNKLAYQDALNYSNSNANVIKKQYDAKANSYFSQANDYLNQAQTFKKQYNKTILDYSFNALGKSGQVAYDWYQNWEDRL